LFLMNSDTVDASGSGVSLYTFYFSGNYGGTGMKGGRSLAQFDLNLNAVPSDTNSQYSTIGLTAQASVNVGGTSGTGNGAGSLFGLNPYVRFLSGATDWSQGVGLEIDMSLRTGASADQMIGMQIVQDGSSTVSPNQFGVAYSANNATGATGWDYLLLDGSFAGYHSLKSTGKIFACYPHANTGNCGTIGSGFDLSNYSTITNNILLGPGSNGKIDGSFNIFANSIGADATHNGIKVVSTTTGVAATIQGTGVDASRALLIESAGTGTLSLGTVTNGVSAVVQDCGGTCADQFGLTGGVTGTPGIVTLNAIGSDTNIEILYVSKGNVGHLFRPGTDSTSAFRVQKAGGGAVYLTVDTSGGTVLLPSITADTAHTDATVCEDTTTHSLYSGSGTIGICLGTSSARYKHSIAELNAGLDQIMQLRPVSYYLNADHGNPDHLLYGFTAEQGGTVLPDLMGVDASGRPNTFDYLGVVPVLVRAVQQQQAEIEQLKRTLR
jgi:hypothetical protein